jgi:DNA-directed RNA polymerase subunit RPC12/RpoP
MMTSNVVEYKCPACGGRVVFDAPSGAMKCDYCGAIYDPRTFAETADVTAQRAPTNQPPVAEVATLDGYTPEEAAHLRQYTCPACGGQLITDVTTAATHCPYCDSPTILPAQLTGQRRPDLVVPFKITRDQVTAALTKHLKGMRLAPKLFRTQAKIDSVQGVYLPFWLFDCEVTGDITYSAERVSTWSDSRNNYTKTDYYRVRRAGQAWYALVPVDAATKADNSYTEAIEPFDYSTAVGYEPSYLLGYLAQTYDVEPNECRPRAHTRVADSFKGSIAATVTGYAHQMVQQESVGISGERLHSALLPVWLLGTVYRGQTYAFAMNGQSGRFVGRLPTAWGRLWAWFFGLWAGVGTAAGAIIYLVAA